MLLLEDVRKGIGQHRLAHDVAPDLTFTGITHDSRLVEPGALFVALRGQRDGHDYIPDAFRRGARGVLAEKSIETANWLPSGEKARLAYLMVEDTLVALQRLAGYWRDKHTVDVVGVTGSVGKTLTKEMTAQVLSQRYTVLKNEGNLNNEIGLPLCLLRLTPGHQKAVLEMAMYALGEIALLCRIAKPQIGIVTNVGPSHLERLGSLERVAQAKAELLEALPAGGLAVLNGDDPLVRAMRPRARTFLFGLRDECQLRAEGLESAGLGGISFTLACGRDRVPVSTPLLGKHSVYACLAAAAVGLESGLSWPEIAEGLCHLPTSSHLAALPGLGGSTILDDTYNASPASTIAALDLLAEMKGRRIAVLGDMLELGSYEEEGHRAVGRRAAQVVSRLVVVGRRARWIGDEARACGLTDVQYADSNREVALEPGAGDCVLVKGSRGMRMEEVVARLRLPRQGA